jgi:predicted nucleic acid-binding protein
LKFEELKAGSQVLIDAGIFIYHFTGLSGECSSFLERCERQEIVGCTTTSVLLEVTHRLMLLEAVSKGLISPGDVARKLRKRPELFGQLRAYAEHVRRIPEMGVAILPVTEELCEGAFVFQQKYGLPVKESVVVAACKVSGCRYLATRDPVFAGVGEVMVVGPTDM